MGKITRKKLTRGTGLVPEHVFDALNQASTTIESVDVDRSQTSAPLAPFCVNISLPYLSHEVVPAGTFTFPFVLPPPQDSFAVGTVGGEDAPGYSHAQPNMKLRSISFSFDQRAEPAAITSHLWQASGTSAVPVTPPPPPWVAGASMSFGWFGMSSEQGKLNYDAVGRLDVRLSLQEKDQWFFGDEYPHRPRREIWSTLIPASAYAGKHLRANPFVQSGMDILVNPFKTYVFVLSCPDLNDPEGRAGTMSDFPIGRFLVLPSIEISMRFTAELLERDSGDAIQNIPRRGGAGDNQFGAKTGPSVTINTPAPATAVEADANDGVEYNVATIDEQFVDKFQGGYNRYADTPPTESLKHDAAYDIITVPLFQNGAHGGICSFDTFIGSWPYISNAGTSNNATSIFDRRMVPIRNSYSIQHVVLAWNWTPFRPLNIGDTGIVPVPQPLWQHPGILAGDTALANIVAPAQDLGLSLGVGIGTGLGADDFGYSQIALLQLQDPNNFAANEPTLAGWGDGLGPGPPPSSLIDRILSTEEGVAGITGSGATGIKHWNWELHSVPMEGSGGEGYYPQGRPIFMGPGWTNTKTRSDLDLTPPPTEGAEQWLEVRAALYSRQFGAGGIIKDTDTVFGVPPRTLGEMGSVLVGYGGCYVYIICKKHLTR